MSLNTVQEIEQAISALKPQELEELCGWLDRYNDSFDARLESDLAAGRLDQAILRALADEKNGEVRAL